MRGNLLKALPFSLVYSSDYLFLFYHLGIFFLPVMVVLSGKFLRLGDEADCFIILLLLWLLDGLKKVLYL